MTMGQKVIKNKVGLLELAKHLRNTTISHICQYVTANIDWENIP